MIAIVDRQAPGVAVAIAAPVVLAIVVVVAVVVTHLIHIRHLLIVTLGVVDLGEDLLVINEIIKIEDVIHLLKVIAILVVLIDLLLKKLIRRIGPLVDVVPDVIDVHEAYHLLVKLS